MYDVALLEVFQFRVGVVDCATAPFAGVESIGAGGGLPVVKLHVLDHALVPLLFFAFTRQ